MKLYKSLYLVMLCVSAIFIGCKEDNLTAEVPEAGNGRLVGDLQFVLPGEENSISHRLSGEEIVFELRQGKNGSRDVVAEFDDSEETLAELTKKYADFKGISLYKLLDRDKYTLPESVIMNKEQTSVTISIKINNQDDGTYVLPLVLKSGDEEVGLQFVEIVNSEAFNIDMTWVDRTPTVEEPRIVAIVEATENDLRNIGNYMLYPYGESQPEKKRPLFDMAVIFSANVNFDEFSCKPVLYYNEDVKRILDNIDIFVRPLQEKGIKVLLSIMPNHQGIGFSNLDISNDRKMIKDFAADISSAVSKYGLDGVMFDDEYADYPASLEAVQPGRPMIQMGSFHFLIKELRDLMPYVEGQQWKDRKNIITMYNIGYNSNSRTGERGWCLFSNDFDYIKNGDGKWNDDDMSESRKAVREWVKNPENQPVLDELSEIKVGELLDYVWNANYQKADNYNQSNEGNRLDGTWIAGMDAEVAKQKFGVASFEMSLEADQYEGIRHVKIYWEEPDGTGSGTRTESKGETLKTQKESGQTSMITFNVQYVPDTWKDSPFTNIYLQDYEGFFKGLGNTNSPVVEFEGTNYDTMTPSYLR
ncbi:DUF1735 domain-containing protein [uncultured Bacteroides sp.]|uniref:BT_3987 domain-containing protein n=1 Tax=uncultured Bacteroides sp. TaxID=162156 RepID=UPI0025F90CE6|nr:DUF1735 domain-containing protein [uncultured Bacteroides sp.]